ncbi:putative methionine--tRNA ligase, cytoplasmic protein rar1 [Didymosphaeria variabile]|uniref:methionine--tRNA ligase n=1 Tax=Didymosphaeria variabile TaxID=1932322 RepID=A0A9W8XUE0_9PLEO|nr:putative methionine--tRNA ligase, cytoplasmic protein rar1 [Didymosphaeria variabile]KAJ4357885.1 putative methionine--tRNA ligase, cytoplasmic protein rar1 [Didymosphaeria variabile]
MADPKKKILPIDGERNVLITSALPYVNNVPHLGNIVGSVLSADVFARYSRARGYNTLYICGTDEYGTATETKAIEEKVTPEQLCAKYNALHADVYKWFNIGFDHFGRTPTQQQTDIAQDIFTKLHKNGYLEEQTTTQPYCETHNSFLADRFVEGTCPLCNYDDARGDQCDKCGHLLDPLELIKPRCKLDGATPVPKETKHVYLLLDKLQPLEEEWFAKASKEGNWSSNGVQITSSWLKEGLKPRGITRDLKWGTAVPLEGYENKVMYVWFDACIGYVSITATYTDEWEKWWRNPENVKLYQFMGKDNVPFHTVVFPCSQIGTGDKWTMLNTISTTEYLNYEHGKFSKSRGIGVFGNNAKETGIPSDVWRYYLLSHRPETGDTEFEWKGFIDSNNNELLKNLGNFVNRVIKFVNSKIYNSVVPDYTKFTSEYLGEHKKKVNESLKRYIAESEDVKIRAALSTALHISSLGNTLLQDNKLDNALATNEPDRCAAVVGLALSHIHLLSSLIHPYMPDTTTSILAQLNASFLTIPDDWEARSLPVGHKIGKAAYLFSQIKPEREQEWREQFGGEEARKAKEEKAAKAAAKKAEKERKKAKKAAAKVGEGVEASEKGGKGEIPAEKTAVEEVAEGVKQTSLQSS